MHGCDRNRFIVDCTYPLVLRACILGTAENQEAGALDGILSRMALRVGTTEDCLPVARPDPETGNRAVLTRDRQKTRIRTAARRLAVNMRCG